MRLYPFHVFRHNGNTYLMNHDRMITGRVAPELVQLMTDIRDNHAFRIPPAAVDQLKKFDLISPKKHNAERALVYDRDVTDLCLMISQRCNLNCVYCFGDNGTYGNESGMDRETAFQAVDWFIGQNKRTDQLKLSFFGGEPLLNFPVVQATLQYAEKQGHKSGKTFNFTLVTNGTLLTDEIIDYLTAHHVMVKVSIDGDQQVHDRQRPFKNGGGSYKKIIPRLQRLLKAEPLTACRATILGNTHPLSIKDTLQKLGFKRVEIQVATPFLDGKGDVAMHQRNTEGMIDLAEFYAEELIRSIKHQDTDKLRWIWKTSELGQKVQLFLRHKRLYFFCGAGNDSVAVATNGDIYPCPSFVGHDTFRIGHVLNDTLFAESYAKSQVAQQETCRDCFAKYTCGGRCYYDNLAMNGSIFEPPEDMCAVEQRRAELAGYISAELTDDDVKFLEKCIIIPPKPWYDDLF